jgi:hypothetical protein
MFTLAIQDATAQPAPAPAPPDLPPVRVGQGGNLGPGIRVNVDGVDITPGFNDPEMLYEAAVAQRRVLRDQLEHLEHSRGELRAELTGTEGLDGTAKAGIQARIAGIDKRIADLDAQLASADAAVARAAGIPGAIVPDRPNPNEVPEEAMVIGILFILFVLFPLTIALARRLWKRGSSGVVQLPPEWHERMHRLEQAVDTVAVEVERVTEGQRFMTRVMTERGLGAGAAQPVEVSAREQAPVPRSGG